MRPRAAVALAALLVASGLLVPTAAAAFPDLAIPFLQTPFFNPEAGQLVNFTANVQNNGDAAAGPFVVRFLIDDVAFGDASVDGLAAGASINVRSPDWRATLGGHTVRAVADAEQRVVESDENNNAMSQPFAVVPPAPRPDLVVNEAGLSRALPRAGTAVNLTARVRNAGSVAAGPSVAEFFLDDASLFRVEVPGIPARESVLVTSSPWVAVEGEHSLRVVADADSDVTEGDEMNNEFTRTITVRSADAPLLPDVAMVDLLSSPRRPAANATAVFRARVENRGEDEAGPFAVGFRIDGTPLGTVAAGPVAPGAAVDVVSPPWNATLGAHLVEAVADPGNVLNETDETNNERALPLAVGPPGTGGDPDLVADRLVASPTAPQPGMPMIFLVRIVRLAAAVNASFAVDFRVDDVSIGERRAEVSDAQSVVGVVSGPWTAVAGTHVASVVVDSGDEVDEPDETNNRAEVTFSVIEAKGRPDLHALEVRAEPANPVAGQAVRFHLRLENRGVPPGAFAVDFLLDGTSLGRERLEGVGADAATDVTSRAWTAVEGNHTLRAVLDPDDDVLEADETNNGIDLTLFGSPAPRPSPGPAEGALLALVAAAAARSGKGRRR